ncbi:hypothetical protein SO802_023577 [Lithocarpus litseifolius]|uniref:Uncharacterized protein n=1 Tax=Lithocarpus litseifolius TaxID=425828 RepID=A0AAW2CAH6_9ROSI
MQVSEQIDTLESLLVTTGLDVKTLSVAIRFLRTKSPEQRAAVDLDTHYLEQEYVKGISATRMQSNYGFKGQLNACWTHKMTRTEIELICSAGFLVSVIHGRHDIIAQIYYARRLAEKLHPVARMIELHGGHLVSHERTKEVNQEILVLIKASEVSINPNEWTNLPKKKSGWIGPRVTLIRINTEGGSNISIMLYVLSRFKTEYFPVIPFWSHCFGI